MDCRNLRRDAGGKLDSDFSAAALGKSQARLRGVNELRE
jgi:hypothetical protein